ncbi:dethiobiotin synthase [Trichothermofontia sichuanensis B231]|uniref:ATP-dependent dethiobiotin synthetase BioD n=1 Tax=Trichothermofontia sichuanensis TaxID=3045816 RepID=UPI002246BF3E|nr:AAA family ATPase [Trichothermofontia sichuanensis]UZQ55690.1 dethiobiotin synthase [Trichothermofontia sichuanensis B231]
MNKTLLIAGTDTGVGKTLLSRALAHYGQTYYADRRIETVSIGLGGLGADSDCPQGVEAAGAVAPAVPVGLECDRLWAQVSQLGEVCDWVLLDGVGSLGTPLTGETTLADLAWDWRLPTLLVVPVASGAIAQAIAQVALARQCRVHVRGMILNCLSPDAAAQIETWVPIDLLQSLTNVRVLGTFPYLPVPTDTDKQLQAVSGLDLDRLFPW